MSAALTFGRGRHSFGVGAQNSDADGRRPERHAALFMPGVRPGVPAMAGVRGDKAGNGSNNSACSAQVLSPRRQGGLKSHSGDGHADAEGFSMAANATSPPAEQASVSFCGAAIPCLWHEGQPFVAVRPISEALGLSWHAQFERIKRDPVLSTSVRVIRTQKPGDDQVRQIVALPFGLLNGWLFGISARRVRPEVRDTLIRYQREAYAVLFQHFYGKALGQRDTSDRVRTAADDPGLIPTRREPLRDIPKPRSSWPRGIDSTADINRRAHDMAMKIEADLRGALRGAVPSAAAGDDIPASVLELLAKRLVESVAGRIIPNPIPAAPRSPAVVSVLSLPDGWLTFDPDDFKVVPGADYLVIGPDATLDITPLLPCDLPRHGVMVLPDRPGSIRRLVHHTVPIVGRVIRRVWL